MSEIERPWSHAVIVCAPHGAKYFGWIDSKEHLPSDYIENCVQHSLPVKLFDARLFATQVQHGQDPNGRMVAGNIVIMMPLDSFFHECPCLNTLVSSWYFPGESDACMEAVKELLKQCKVGEEHNENLRRAASAGIELVLPGTRIPRPPKGTH